MQKQNIFIIEDELNNRDLLISLLDENFSSSVEIIGSSGSILESELFLKQNKVDILLLDIELSDGQIFELLNKIEFLKYKLIFTTGYSEHAIKAIKYAAVDYLLKPINTSELIAAMGKVLNEQLSYNPILEDIVNRKQFDITEYIIINSTSKVEKIPIDQIVFLKADGIYTEIHHGSSLTISSKPIGIYDDILPEEIFFRSHKSYMINKNFIKKIEKGRGLFLTLHNGNEVPVAIRKKDEFLQWYYG